MNSWLLYKLEGVGEEMKSILQDEVAVVGLRHPEEKKKQGVFVFRRAWILWIVA